MKNIIVIESPNKVKKIAEYTGAEVFATVGHFKDLPSKEMGVDLVTYEPDFVFDDKKKTNIQKIKSAASGSKVYIATDPDREGYAIGSFVYQEIKKSAAECWRLEIREITKNGIEQAMKAAVKWESTNNGEYDAFLGRRVGDRICGYLLSPQANKALDGKYSVGRVQSPAVRLVVEREREIRNFKPTPYFTITANITHENGTFVAKYDGKESFDTEEEAKKAIEAVKDGSEAIISNIEAKESLTAPKAPFTTLEMQSAASTQLNISPDDSMSLAQSLFEHGLITYHRTDSSRLSDDFIEEARNYIGGAFSSEYLPSSARSYKSKNSQAEAHEAVRPSHIHPLDEIDEMIKKEGLNDEHKKLYTLIFKRTLASQMANAVFDATNVSLTIEEVPFKASGRVLKFDGFLSLYNEIEEDTENEKEESGSLPKMKIGDTAAAAAIINSKMRQAPARFTESTLLKALEKAGIGRPSTYASIMKIIKDREYVSLQKKKLHTTQRGESLIGWLEESNQWIIDYKFTADMEEYLDEVENKKDGKSWQLFCKNIHEKMDFYKPSNQREDGPPSPAQIDFANKLAAKNNIILNDDILGSRLALSKWIDTQTGGSKKASSEPIGKCSCGGDIKEWDKSFQCQSCKGTVWKDFLGKKITKTQAINLLTNKTIELKGLVGKSEKPFDAKAEFKEGKVNLIFANK